MLQDDRQPVKFWSKRIEGPEREVSSNEMKLISYLMLEYLHINLVEI